MHTLTTFCPQKFSRSCFSKKIYSSKSKELPRAFAIYHLVSMRSNRIVQCIILNCLSFLLLYLKILKNAVNNERSPQFKQKCRRINTLALKPNVIRFCDVCGSDFYSRYRSSHLKTKEHILASLRQHEDCERVQVYKTALKNNLNCSQINTFSNFRIGEIFP